MDVDSFQYIDLARSTILDISFDFTFGLSNLAKTMSDNNRHPLHSSGKGVNSSHRLRGSEEFVCDKKSMKHRTSDTERGLLQPTRTGPDP